ncbi:TonB-dependent receptor [Altererythrobacter sp. CC-YST694]|uniref:TonB-dependent receptor n=1 Tax=Altererythrobacter sp. CC-YST694 TaxID=2755038 RepID=UPI001D033A95|nr:TonB-dependent receptor [Altererythrobacter sp. CC-YST694]MCB5426069.1 TonB-dependent receptor [Altererythrobacter sp. CC-YST694]
MRFHQLRAGVLIGASLTCLALANAAHAEEAAAAAESDTPANEIVVYGKGETRQVQAISSEDIVTLLPGTSPLKAIEKLPSVNFQSADPFGNYEWSTRVTIRSFNQNQLGFTFDGIPLGDMTYGNHNGLHISRVISPENVGRVEVSQGAGTLGTQSTNNLGGTVENFSRDPEDRFAADAAVTYGSNETMRGFVRLNAGSANGARGYVSYAYGSTDKYKGKGMQDQHMVNAKLVIPIGAAEVDGWVSYSDRREQDYQDMSLDMLERLGYGSDNLYGDWALAIKLADIANNIDSFNNTTGLPGADGLSDITGLAPSNPSAGTVFPGDYKSVDDAYYDAAGLRKDFVASLGVKAPLGDKVNLSLKGYYHNNRGMGLWATPYVPSPNGTPISVRTTEYEIDRGGIFGSLDIDLGSNQVSVGGWYEHNEFNQARRFYALASRTDPGFSFRTYPKNPFYTQWEFDFTTDTLQYFVADKIDLGSLKVNLGWKGFKVTNEADAVVQATYPEGRIKAEDWFQPHVGLVYELTDNAEVFAGFTQSTRAYASATTTGPFSTNQAGFDAIKNTLKPESSDTYEAGLRYNTSSFNGVVGVYLVNFQNRLQSVAVGSSIQGNPSALQNVGSVRSLGFEAAGDLKLGSNFSLYASYSYTDATYRDDVVDGDGKVISPIKGKTLTDSPEHMARGELAYDDGKLFGRVGLNWMSERYFTYLNDQSVDARLLADASLGYRFTDKIELQLNATNLFDKQYIATVGSGGYGDSGDRQTLLVGAPRQVFVTLKAGF